MTPKAPDPHGLAERLYQHVEFLAGRIGPRTPLLPAAWRAAESYVERELGAVGGEVVREPFLAGGVEVANYFLERRGATRPGQIVVLGAHYDTTPFTPGADDNASAVAVLIEVARLLRDVPCERTIRYVAFACEEAPYFHSDGMGSRVHAVGCRRRGEDLIGMACLEMVGYYTDDACQQLPPGIPGWLRWAFPRRGNFLAAVGNLRSAWLAWQFHRGFRKLSDFPLFSIALPERIGSIRLSDNSSFWDQGYPALMLTDTSFLRNPHYHLSSDTVETLAYGRMTQAALGIAGGIAYLARRQGGWTAADAGER